MIDIVTSETGPIVEDALASLKDRGLATPALAGPTVAMFFELYSLAPEKISVDRLLTGWTDHLKPSSAPSILQALYAIVDDSLLGGNHSQQVMTAAYWFLGENALALVGDLPWQDGRNSQQKPPSNQVAPPPPSSSLPELFLASLRSDVLSSIVFRLQRGCVFGPFEIRSVCVHAISKLALLSGEPLRIQLYEFLLEASAESALDVRSIALPVLKLLDQIYEAYSKGSELGTDQSLVRDRIRLYCSPLSIQ